jgi:hypothetical protein
MTLNVWHLNGWLLSSKEFLWTWYVFKGCLCLHLQVEGKYNGSMAPNNKTTLITRPQQIIKIMYPVLVTMLCKCWKPNLAELCSFCHLRCYCFKGKTMKFIVNFFSVGKIIILKCLVFVSKETCRVYVKSSFH